MGVKEEQKEETSPTSTCGLAPSRLVGRLVMRVKRHARKDGMEEHPLFEQGDACPAIRLPLQQCEAMEKAFRWPVAPRQSEPCLYGRLLFVQIACKCLQFRLAMLLHFFQPPPQPISLALTQHMTKGLHLACRASQRLVGLDQPRPQDAQRAVFSIEAPWQARSTLALVHGQGFRHLLLSRKRSDDPHFAVCGNAILEYS